MHLRAEAPAKVNLSLLVGPRRADGYHELFTVFVPVDLADGLEFDLRAEPPGAPLPGAQNGARPPSAQPPGRPGDLRVWCTGIAGESNLAARALRAIENATGWTIAGTVAIEKRIPVGAGLGGGSSDAAAALRAGAAALVEAGGPVLDPDALEAIALTLGADVPFFLEARPALALGIGEILEPLRLPALDIVLVFPGEQLSTSRVYGTFDVLHASEDHALFERRVAEVEALWKAFAGDWEAGDIQGGAVAARIAALLQNDLEGASFRLLPLLVETKRIMVEEGARGVLMSGSGSTMFAVCDSADAATDLARKLAARGISARPAKTGLGPFLA